MIDSEPAVAVSGDTIVVGSEPGERVRATGVNGDQTDDSLFAPGAAYVFVRDRHELGVSRRT